MNKEELEKCREYFDNLSVEVNPNQRITKIWDQYGASIWDEASGKPMPQFYAGLLIGTGARILDPSAIKED